VDMEEFVVGIRAIDASIPAEDLRELMAVADADGSGELDFLEMSRAFQYTELKVEYPFVIETAAKILARELDRSTKLIKQSFTKALNEDIKTKAKKETGGGADDGALSTEAALRLCKEIRKDCDIAISQDHLSALLNDSATVREDADEFAALLIALGFHALRCPWFKGQEVQMLRTTTTAVSAAMAFGGKAFKMKRTTVA